MKNKIRTWLAIFSVSVVGGGAMMVPIAVASKVTTISWKLTSLPSSTAISLSAIAATNSSGTKAWTVSGSCVLRNGKVVTQSSGYCSVRLSVSAKGGYSARTSSKKFSIIETSTTLPGNLINSSPTTTTQLLGYKQSMSWGEVAITQISGPKPGGCVDVPIKVDVRTVGGLSLGFIISMTDDYSNRVGEIRPDAPFGVQNLTMHVCRDPWVYTYSNGVTDNRAGALYCGFTFKFWPTTYPTVRYMWNDPVCKNSSDRL